MSAVIIYLDISNAFDKIARKTLLTKLRLAGITGLLLAWFHSYLSEHTQAMAIPDALSTVLPITSGVIQGSVLGPILFLLYIIYTFPQPTLVLLLQVSKVISTTFSLGHKATASASQQINVMY